MIVSAFHDENSVENAELRGIKEYLVKPFKIESIGQNPENRLPKPILAPEVTEVFTNLP